MRERTFRQDINGLRAIAVLGVLLFHFKSELLPGGFAGVDVFFVISGFLMTSIIFKGIESGDFSIVRFIKNRAKRIVPALLVTILLVLFVGYFAFEPLTYKLVGKHGAASLLFVSNIVYDYESGYFDPASYSKLFLHTWSLSVEWQFYIIYPLIIYAASRFTNIKVIKYALLVGFVILFVLCVIATKNNQSSAYFQLYSRAWEMIAGGLAFVFPFKANEKVKTIFEMMGLVIIGVSFFIFSKDTPWPGQFALLPVFGAYLCILANNSHTFLSGRIIQSIGLWSYSIYLIHWPLIVISNKLSLSISLQLYLLIVLSISFFNFRIIERKRDYGYKTVLVYAISLASLFYVSINGMEDRVDELGRIKKEQIFDKFYGGAKTFANANGNIFNLSGKEPEVNLILTGDSYSQQYNDFWSKTEYKPVSVSMVVCLLFPDYTSHDNDKCDNMYEKLDETMKKYPNADIVINQNWGAYASKSANKHTKELLPPAEYNEMVTEQVSKIISSGGNERRYFIVGTYDYPDYDVIGCLASASLPINKILPTCKETTAKKSNAIDNSLKALSSSYPNVYFISPRNALCKNDKCLVIKNHNPIHFDGDHLSIYGSEIVGSYIKSKVDKK